MIAPLDRPRSVWPNAVHAAALFAVDMPGIAGVNLRARPGPAREAWLELLRELLPASCPIRRVPYHVSDEQLLGGLDLTATLRSGRPVAEPGLLVQANGGILILTGAERASAALAAHIGAALDSHQVNAHPKWICGPSPTRVGLVMLDEGIDDEKPPWALLDRVGFHLDLNDVRWGEIVSGAFSSDSVIEARRRLVEVDIGDDVLCALCEAATAFGIESLRAPLLAVRTARIAAALAGQCVVRREDAALAAALVLAPRATVIPQSGPPSPETEQETSDTNVSDDSHGREREVEAQGAADNHQLTEVVVEAARSAMPPTLLAQLQRPDARIARANAAGRVGGPISSLRRGRPVGVRRGELRAGARLNVIETLRAAAPWQALRHREIAQSHKRAAELRRVEVRRDDFRITRLEHRSETTSIFAVDASGSSALHRLAEAKGAVEQLLADCYIRRDHVALIAFRGRSAELILPPTRSLARAKRSLAGLPGGGGTPLATAIDAATTLATALRRRGQSPVIVLLTDGRANVARDGTPGREKAASDAVDAARVLRSADIAALVVDISPQPNASAERLAVEMGARYLALPQADAKSLSLAVQSASVEPNGRSAVMMRN